MKNSLPPIFCAIDTPDLDRAHALAQTVARAGCGIKFGLEFFGAQGPENVSTIMDSHPGLPLFLDLKFHDIPNTVAAAVCAVAPLGAAYINVHASGGIAMMRAAQEAAEKSGITPPHILGVTVLTSMENDGTVTDRVVTLAKQAKEAGLAGVVCSAHEIKAVRAACGDDFILMVPGIRPAGYAASDDQRRTMTPREAMAAGATHLVIGRPITAAPDPAAAAQDILKEING